MGSVSVEALIAEGREAFERGDATASRRAFEAALAERETGGRLEGSRTRALAAAMKPFTTGSAYLNFVTEESGDRVVAAFGTKAYVRLQTLKDRYDPDNLFRSNQNIEPALRRTTALEAC